MSASLTSTALVLGAYLLGSVPFGLVLGLARGVDIRETGSGNIGATNLARARGRRWGILAFLLDYAKGLLPVVVAARWYSNPAVFSLATTAAAGGGPQAVASGAQWLPLAAGGAAVLGHVFPVYLRFKGGKGVATAFGVMTALAWPAALAGAVVWLILFFATRTVSIASMAAAVALPLGVAARGWGAGAMQPPLLFLFAVALAVLLLARHRANIARLLRGEELRFPSKPH